jgi:hypothetical protein
MRINIPPRDLPDNPHVPMLVDSYHDSVQESCV